MMIPRTNACWSFLIASTAAGLGEEEPVAMESRTVFSASRLASSTVLRNLRPASKWRGSDVLELPFFKTKPTEAESNKCCAGLARSAEYTSRLKLRSVEPTAGVVEPDEPEDAEEPEAPEAGGAAAAPGMVTPRLRNSSFSSLVLEAARAFLVRST